MPTTTADPIDQARHHLADVETKRDQLRERVAGGDTKITAKQIADADDAIALAQLQLEGARQRKAEADAADRRRRATELRDALAAGTKRDDARELFALVDQAAALIGRLHDRAAVYTADLAATINELRDLGPLDDVAIHYGSSHPSPSDLPQGISIDGTYWPLTDDHLPGQLVAEAIARGLTGRNLAGPAANTLARLEGYSQIPGGADDGEWRSQELRDAATGPNPDHQEADAA